MDQRLAALQTDYVDLIFIHAVGDHNFKVEVEWPKSKEFKETADAIRKSGKARFVGFSTHHANRDQILQNAAKGGFVDAIMVQNNPWIAADAKLNRALDACHKAGIGLISMKQVAGQTDLDQIGKATPGFEGERPQALPGALACDLDRRTLRVVLRLDAQHGSGA